MSAPRWAASCVMLAPTVKFFASLRLDASRDRSTSLVLVPLFIAATGHGLPCLSAAVCSGSGSRAQSGPEPAHSTLRHALSLSLSLSLSHTSLSLSTLPCAMRCTPALHARRISYPAPYPAPFSLGRQGVIMLNSALTQVVIMLNNARTPIHVLSQSPPAHTPHGGIMLSNARAHRW